MFLGTQRDLTRVSTPVAQKPLHLTPARDVTNQRFTGDWKLVDYNRHCHMIVHTSNDLFQRAMDRNKERWKGTKEDESGRGGEGERGGEGKIEGKARKGEEGQKRPQSTAAKSQALTVYKQMKKAEVGNPKSRFFSKLFQIFKKSQASQPLDADEPLPSLATTLEFDPNNLKELFSDFLDGLHDDIKASQELGELLMSHSIRIIDSGGQPQFHDIVSIFLSYISGFLSIYKLSEYFADHGEVAFFNSAGMLTNEPYESHYTHEQVIRHNLLAIQSQVSCDGIEEMPNLAFVGTFLDQQHLCPETPDQKDERLHSMITEILPEEMQQCVITNGGSLKKASFRVNARTPGPLDFQSVERLKVGLIARSRAPTRNLPLKWHAGLFESEALLQVFTSLLVISEVGAGKYLVPCVLEVSSIYPSPPLAKGCVRSSFVLNFSKNSPIFGIYGCTISSLMSDAGWKLLTERGEVVQVARNCTTFELPARITGKVTLFDPLSCYLEVVVELPHAFAFSKQRKTLYPKIRDATITAVRKALNYKVYTPELTFLCPEQSSLCSESPHPATLLEEEGHHVLVCSIRPSSVCHLVSGENRKWLPKPTG